MARQLDSLVPRARGKPAIFSILFVSLFACSLATSSSLQRQQQQGELFWRPVSSQSQQSGAWDRYAPSSDPGLLDSRFEPLYERPTVYAAPERLPADESVSDDDDDEQFLRQLKVAAEYLDEKLAQRQREQQQQRALLAKLGRFVDSSSSSPTAAVVDLGTGQGPAYSLGGGYDDTYAPSGQETPTSPVVVVAPSLDLSSSQPTRSEFSRGSGGSQLDSPNYRLLDALDDAASRQQPTDQQVATQTTYDNYKQLLQTLLSSDRAQPAATQDDQLATSSAVKRDESRDFEHVERPRSPKLTTLVEDEQEGQGGDAPTLASTATTTTTTTTEATTTSRANETTTGQQQQQQQPPAYGKKVYAKGNNSSAGGGGVFSRMYAQLAQYLPFMNQINILRNPTSSGDILKTTTTDNAHNHDEHHHEDKKLAVEVGRPKAKKKDDNDDNNRSRAEADELHAKPSVSVSMARQQHTELKEEDKSEDRDDNNQNDDQDKQHVRVKVSVLSEGKQQAGNEKEKEDKSDGQQVAATSKSGNAKRLISVADTPMELGEPLEMGQMMPVIIEPHAYSHLMRQPNQEAAAGEADAGGSLMGKYIYAPTQHYYLNSVLPTTSSDHSQQQQQQQHHQLLAASQQQQARRFRPGDEVYGSYEPMKASYAFQKDPSVVLSGPGGLGPSGLASKTNDLYFLVMVGAFCVMAMAVVLAAGAFAYRVQQSRKSSQEQDYPTYGVVGPNNMSGGGNGKCGASAFAMGGYFMGPPGGAGGSSSSKSGSVKHLADLYGHPVGVNGASATAATGNARDVNGGSDSGLNSLGRSSHSGNSAKKAASSSASSLNNAPVDNQSAGGRTAPGSFMSAASQDAARMYHYQHQKQQMIISDRNSTAAGRHTSASDLDSEDENDDGSYTVYECPGLASAHEMEIKNPLFNDDQTP